MKLFLLFMFVFLLITCDGLDRVVVEEGSDALLSCSVGTKQNIGKELFDWRKDNKKEEVFLYNAGNHYNNGRYGQDKRFSGRVTHFPHELNVGNASIIIRKATMSDAGNYTCVFPRLRPGEVTHVMLIVVQAVFEDKSEELAGAAKPCTSIVNASEDGVLLKCEVRGASSKPEVEWQDIHGNVFPAGHLSTTERGGGFYATVYSTVTLASTNRFRCVSRQKDISHTSHAELFVPVVAGAISKPRIQMLDATKDGVLLTCEVRDAFPKPELEWLDSDGNVLHAEEPQITESGGRFNISLRTTVTKTSINRFRCVAKQQTINHATDDDVIVPEKMFENCNTGLWICGVLCLAVGAVCGSLFTALIIRYRKTHREGRHKGTETGTPLSPRNGYFSVESSTENGNLQSTSLAISTAGQST